MATASGILLVTYWAPNIEKIEARALHTGGDDAFAITAVVVVKWWWQRGGPTSLL